MRINYNLITSSMFLSLGSNARIVRYCFVLIFALFITGRLNAQANLKHHTNYESQPIWGPTGYDYVVNYYFPDIEVYYNIPQHCYYYNEKGNWVRSAYLRSQFGKFDLYNSYKVVINEQSPWQNHEKNKIKYYIDKGRRDQHPISESKDSKYFANKYHPEHDNWIKQQNSYTLKNKMTKQNKTKNFSLVKQQ